MAKAKERNFKIIDIDCVATVEIVKTRKDIFDLMDEYIDNLQYDFFDPTDEAFDILYKDGSWDSVDESYDGHKIRRTNIISIVETNICTAIVYGPFEINEYGVVTSSDVEKIAEENIIEI